MTLAMRSRYRLAAVGLLLLASTGMALAQAGATIPAGGKFDLTAIIVSVVNQAFAVVLAFGTYLINQKIHNQQMRDLLSKTLVNAVGVVKGQAEQAIKSSPIQVTATNNAALNAGVQYVLNNAKEAVDHFNISESKIAEKIAARIGLVDLGVPLQK